MTSLGEGLEIPPESRVTGTADDSKNGLTSVPGQAVTVEGPFSSERPVMVLEGTAGTGKGILVALVGGDGKKVPLIALKSGILKVPQFVGDKHTGFKDYPDHSLFLNAWNEGKAFSSKYSVRPNPYRYKTQEQVDRAQEWAQLPGASEHHFILEMRPTSENQAELWLDGRLMATFSMAMSWSDYTAYSVKVEEGAALNALRFSPVLVNSRVALPIARHARVRGTSEITKQDAETRKPFVESTPVEGMADAQLHFSANEVLPPGFMALADRKAEGIAIGGLSRILGLARLDLTNQYWSRQAADNLPEQRMFTVPLATYSYAEVLCAVDDAPERVNELTLRVTRYGRGRGDAMADSIVTVPRNDGEASKAARKVGAVTYGPAAARKTAALWVIRVPIRNEAIADLFEGETARGGALGATRYLDVELLEPLLNVEEASTFPPKLDLSLRQWTPVVSAPAGHDFLLSDKVPPVSGVTVFGLELQKSPAAMRVRSNIGHQVFYASDKPEFIAEIKASKGGRYTVEWEVSDTDGKIADTGKASASLTEGAEHPIAIPLTQGNGWYAIRLRLLSEDEELVVARTSFVMLPPDTRKAGYESPFYGWCFTSGHAAPIKLDEMGPLFQRAGIRRVDATPEVTESLSEKYGFTESHISWTSVGGGRTLMNAHRDGTLTLEEAINQHEAHIRSQLELWPSIDRMLVFHESGDRGAPFPSELWGEVAKTFQIIGSATSPEALLQEEGAAVPNPTAEKAKAEWMKNWPKRIEYLKAMAQMVRAKFPNLKMQYGNNGDGVILMGELFRQKFPREWIDTIAVEDLGQTIAPEHLMIGGVHSAWFLRETARKMGYGDIPVTACTEWIGRMTEHLGPRQQAEWKARDALLALAYGFDTISVAGLNDSGVGYYFSGWGNGGLCTRYPLLAPKPAYAAIATLTQVLDRAKFKRFVPTGSTVLYAQEFQRADEWVYALWTPRGDRELVIEFPSDESRKLVDLYGRENSLQGTSIRLKAGTGVQYLTSKTPLTSVIAGASSFPEDKAPSNPATEIAIESVNELSLAPVADGFQMQNVPHKKGGKFEIREVTDPEMGACIEVELIPEKPLPWDAAYEHAYLKFAQPFRTDAKNAGVWIKGNGGWGTVNIEKSQPDGPWLTSHSRHFGWQGKATINFDGWNFVRYPHYNWSKNESFDIKGVTISIPRKVLVGTEMVPNNNLKVRIKKILLF